MRSQLEPGRLSCLESPTAPVMTRYRRQRWHRVDDTGSSYSVFPRTMLERLGVVPRFLLPNSKWPTAIQRDVGLAMLVMDDSESSMRVIFGDDD